MRRFLSGLSLGLSLVCAAGIAGAQTATPPAGSAPAAALPAEKAVADLTGIWTGTSKSIVSGLPAHHPVTTPATIVDGNRLTEIEIRMHIDGQEDRRFWGTLRSAVKVDPLIGVIARDGKRVRMVAQGGGVIEAMLLDDGTLELFYTESRAGVSVAATNLLTRQKR